MGRHGKRALLALKPGDKRPGGRPVYTRAYKSGSKLAEVYDLDFAAYCMLRGCNTADMQRAGGYPERYVFTFTGTPEDVEKYAIDFTNSEAARHADCVRRLKKSLRIAKPSSKPHVVRQEVLYQPRADGTVDVYKLDFAAYCLLCGERVAALVKTGGVKGQGPEQYICTFESDDADIRELAETYPASESAQHAECVKRLKKSIRRQNGR